METTGQNHLGNQCMLVICHIIFLKNLFILSQGRQKIIINCQQLFFSITWLCKQIHAVLYTQLLLLDFHVIGTKMMQTSRY